jgi:hypothetical protein
MKGLIETLQDLMPKTSEIPASYDPWPGRALGAPTRWTRLLESTRGVIGAEVLAVLSAPPAEMPPTLMPHERPSWTACRLWDRLRDRVVGTPGGSAIVTLEDDFRANVVDYAGFLREVIVALSRAGDALGTLLAQRSALDVQIGELQRRLGLSMVAREEIAKRSAADHAALGDVA